jgi:hypothetical protein
MSANARELWLLAFYRNSELHGALLMGRLARSYTDPILATNLTHHCATEARHAALLTDALAALGSPVNLETGTIQERYGAEGGIPTELTDLLVLSEILEKRVLASYRTHLARSDVSPIVRRTLQMIVSEMEQEEDGTDPHAGWIDRVLDDMPAQAVTAAKDRWRRVDAEVSAALMRLLDERFGEPSGR